MKKTNSLEGLTKKATKTQQLSPEDNINDTDLQEGIDYENDEFQRIMQEKGKENDFGNNELYLYFAEVGEYGLLKPEEEKTLGQAARNGDKQAFDKMIQGNLRLVVMIAQRYENRGLDILDLISEGNLGLIHAVQKYEPDKGFRFSTYAVWWIRHYIEKALMNHGRTIRVPIHINKAITRLMKELKSLSQKLKREVTVRELATATEQSIFEVMELLANHEAILSLDATISTEGDGDFYQFAADINRDDSVKFLIDNEVFTVLEAILLELEPNARKVIEYRFGVNGKKNKTLERTGELLGLTRDQVRYLQMKTLEKMRDLLSDCDISFDDLLN